jgi:hypothetical protein
MIFTNGKVFLEMVDTIRSLCIWYIEWFENDMSSNLLAEITLLGFVLCLFFFETNPEFGLVLISKEPSRFFYFIFYKSLRIERFSL